MAKLKVINRKGKYFDSDAKSDVSNYILNPDKTCCYGGIAVDRTCPAESMELISELFGKTRGVQLRHYVLSFSPEEVRGPEIINQIAQQIANYIGLEYQVIYGVHYKKENPHIHFMFNSVSYLDGHRFYGTHKEFYRQKDAMRAILREHRIFQLNYIPVGQ